MAIGNSRGEKLGLGFANKETMTMTLKEKLQEKLAVLDKLITSRQNRAEKYRKTGPDQDITHAQYLEGEADGLTTAQSYIKEILNMSSKTENIVDFAPPRNPAEESAMRWIEGYTPEERTAQLKRAHLRWMQDQRQATARVSGE
jgi:hypothetical protein